MVKAILTSQPLEKLQNGKTLGHYLDIVNWNNCSKLTSSAVNDGSLCTRALGLALTGCHCFSSLVCVCVCVRKTHCVLFKFVVPIKASYLTEN